jgi:hypothetical protein
MARAIQFLLMIGIAACTPTLDASRKAAIRNVAVVSAIGDEIQLTRIGLIALGNEYQTDRIDLGLDRIAVSTVERTLRASNAAASIVPVNYDAQSLADRLYKRESPQPFADPARIGPMLREIARDKPLDAILLVTRWHENRGPVYFQGVGLFTEKTIRERAPVTPYASLQLYVLDAKTFDVMGQARGQREGRLYNLSPLISSKPLGGPAPFLAGFNFPMNAEQRNFLRPPLEELVSTTVQDLMQRAGF